MALKLSGTSIANRIADELRTRIQAQNWTKEYVAIIYVGDNPASALYVRKKQEFAQRIGLPLRIIGQNNEIQSYDDMMDTLMELAYDDDCLGFMPQLPLPGVLHEHRMEFFDAIPVYKDIDGLGSEFIGKFITEQINFLGATPQAVLSLLDHYGYGTLKGKTVAIVGQSNLIGKPLALAMLRRGASVLSSNADTPDAIVRETTKIADIIISCTGVVHRLDENYIRSDQSQVLIDVGRGSYEGKPAGDMKLATMKDLVAAYTPVPGGVGPLTIAHLFHNLKLLYQQFQQH